MTDRDTAATPAASSASRREQGVPDAGSAGAELRLQRLVDVGRSEGDAVVRNNASPYQEPPTMAPAGMTPAPRPEPSAPPPQRAEPTGPAAPFLTIAPGGPPAGMVGALPRAASAPVAAGPGPAGPSAPSTAQVIAQVTTGDTPALGDFLSGGDAKIRDLIAYGLAVESGKPVGPAEIGAFRERAEAELHAHAFRTLHNQVEAIRREAMDEQLARMPRALSFNQTVLASLAAVGLGFVVILLLWLASPLFPVR